MLKKLLLGLAIALSLPTLAKAQGGEPIRIGLLTADTGMFAFFQSHYTDAAKLAVENLNNNGGILGRKVELIIQGHNGGLQAVLLAAQKLAEQDKALFIFGFATSAMSMAVAPRVTAWNTIFLDSSASIDELTTKQCNKNYFRSINTNEMAINLFQSIVEEKGYKTWQVLANDQETMHAFTARFAKMLESIGGRIVNSAFAPVGTPDWGSYISQLSAKPTEALIVFAGAGGDALTIPKQAKQFGLFAKYKLVLSVLLTNDIVLDAQGDSTVGLYSSLSYSTQMPGDKNATFVKLYTDRYKRPPSFLAAEQWQAVELMKAAIERAGTTDVESVRKALLGLKASTIMGDVEMRASDHQLQRPMALIQIESAGEGKAAMALRKIEPASKVLPAATVDCN
ncbi:MAG TPA: ABC transporter substrate-binding protein [Bradyrhizobium sp.]|nr:ABC transporter substrate-binding protein [Bradyrhizobium sp.]